MQRALAAAAVVAAAGAVWAATFFLAAWSIVWLIATFEGETSECWRGECGRFGELLDDHDLLATAVLAAVAALPAAGVLWKARSRFRRKAGPGSRTPL